MMSFTYEIYAKELFFSFVSSMSSDYRAKIDSVTALAEEEY